MVDILGMITQSHYYDQTSFYNCVELWVISVLEIGHVFPLIAVDINELAYLCGSKRVVYPLIVEDQYNGLICSFYMSKIG